MFCFLTNFEKCLTNKVYRHRNKENKRPRGSRTENLKGHEDIFDKFIDIHFVRRPVFPVCVYVSDSVSCRAVKLSVSLLTGVEVKRGPEK